MCGMPKRSRMTRTGCARPATASVPHAAIAAAASKIRLQPRTMALKDTLLAEFDHEMGTTRRLLERVPDAQLGWKPHEKSMTLGGLATHLSNLPNWGTTILSDTSYDLAAGPPHLSASASRAEVLANFD